MDTAYPQAHDLHRPKHTTKRNTWPTE